MKEHRCLRCGHKGHYVSDCKVSLLCYLCKGDHWTPPCPSTSTTKSKSEASVTDKKSVSQRLSHSGESPKNSGMGKPTGAGKSESSVTPDKTKGGDKIASETPAPTVNKSVTVGTAKDRGGGVALPTALLIIKTHTVEELVIELDVFLILALKNHSYIQR